MIRRTFLALFVTVFAAAAAQAQTKAIRFGKLWDGTRTITDAVVIDGYSQPGASMDTLAVGNNAKIGRAHV